MKIKVIMSVFCVGTFLLLSACSSSEPSDEVSTAAPTSTAASSVATIAQTESEFESESEIPQTTSSATQSEGSSKIATTAVSKVNKGEKYPEYAQKYAYAGYKPQETNSETFYLMLLNVNYCLPEDYQIERADAGGGVPLDRRVVPAYKEMYNAALDAGYTLTPRSGWRSLERQSSNLENSIAEEMRLGYNKTEATHRALQYIMLPGCSEHNAGLAMDIITYSTDYNFEDTPEYEWLMKNAADYGFILRYPKDKEKITRVKYEPWHWRYVGKEAAKEIMAKGICLEEYLGYA